PVSRDSVRLRRPGMLEGMAVGGAQSVLKGTGRARLPRCWSRYVALRDEHADFLLLFGTRLRFH
ncbi:hypothetical protein CTI14_42670, partial [Methylobacterium radiotolerans]